MDSPVFDAMRTGVDDHTEIAVAELLQRHGERIAASNNNRQIVMNSKPNVGHWFFLVYLLQFCGLIRVEGPTLLNKVNTVLKSSK